MASCGVWENVILCKTPTFDGVCGILFFIMMLLLSKVGVLQSITFSHTPDEAMLVGLARACIP